MNQFSKSEKELVDKIVDWAKRARFGDVYIKNMTIHFAQNGVKEYAEPCDQEAAAAAVIELVKERLNAH